jgi:hypothetical protein
MPACPVRQANQGAVGACVRLSPSPGPPIRGLDTGESLSREPERGPLPPWKALKKLSTADLEGSASARISPVAVAVAVVVADAALKSAGHPAEHRHDSMEQGLSLSGRRVTDSLQEL